MNKILKLIVAIALLTFVTACGTQQKTLLPGVKQAPYLYGELTEQSLTILEGELIFNNLTATQLKPSVGKKMINQISNPALRKLATELYNKTYKPGLRLANYEAYMSPKSLGRKYRIGDGFSNYEGVTGIVLEAGVHPIFVGSTHGERISLVVPDWTRRAPEGVKPTEDPAGWGLHSKEFALHEGINMINIEQEGLVYVRYYTEDEPMNHQPIVVHFPTGKENGYFDITRGDNDEDFNRLLENAVSPILDMKGKHIQAAFPVERLKENTWGKGVELINNFDSIVALQYRFIGWEKEQVIPKNHVLARVNYHYYMFRDGDGVAYLDNSIHLVANPASTIKGDPCWGFSHELGHVLQMRPQITWSGMTEVSNNILTLYSTTMMGNRSRLSAEGRYAKAREEILDRGFSYLGSSSDGDANQYGGGGTTDVFHRLVPFWQLHLYFAEQGYPEFYADLMIAMRNQESLSGRNRNKGWLDMLEFTRLASKVSKTDLTEFFERWGFYYVGKVEGDDYGRYSYDITQEAVDSVKKDIADMNLPKPKKDITLYED